MNRDGDFNMEVHVREHILAIIDKAEQLATDGEDSLFYCISLLEYPTRKRKIIIKTITKNLKSRGFKCRHDENSIRLKW
jgi:hypothetical protein